MVYLRFADEIAAMRAAKSMTESLTVHTSSVIVKLIASMTSWMASPISAPISASRWERVVPVAIALGNCAVEVVDYVLGAPSTSWSEDAGVPKPH